MFGMGFTEIVFIAVIAILFLGPEKLPQTMVDIARFFKKMKSTIADTKEELEKELQISELKSQMHSYKEQLDAMSEDVKNVTKEASIKNELQSVQESIDDAARIEPPKEPEKSVRAQPEREVVTFPKKGKEVAQEDTTTLPKES